MIKKRVNGVRFGDLHSYYDFGLWLSLRPDYGNPVPKSNTVEVPGMDGVLDMTEANSEEVKYSNRTLVFTFAKMVELEDQETFKAQVRSALHGKYIKQIIPDEAPDYYYSGRAEVTFTKLSSWKLRCVVTVDAAPYAMKVEETKVNLYQVGTPGPQAIDIEAEDVAMQDWNSDLRRGTKTFPAGWGVPNLAVPNLIIKWPSNAGQLPGYTPRLQVVDSDNHVYNAVIHAPFSGGEVMVAGSELVDAGLTPGKVYRILVNGIGGCTLHAEMGAYRYRIWNERKQVIPSIVFRTEEDSLVETEITVNGETFVINNETTMYEDIILREGWNDIMLPITIDGDVTDLYMVFREGRL